MKMSATVSTAVISSAASLNSGSRVNSIYRMLAQGSDPFTAVTTRP
jgi:hypothetical protein